MSSAVHMGPEPARAMVLTEASQTRAKKIGDREKTAARLLRSAIERSFDAEIDIDWDEPWMPGKKFAAEHRLSLYGTRIWDKLAPEQRLELGRHEMASILSFGIFAEAVLSTFLFRHVIKAGLANDSTRYALTEIGDETRHSTMFSRMINKLEVEPYELADSVSGIISLFTSFLPPCAATWGGTLVIEEILDRMQREMVVDEAVQPHIRQLTKIHVLEEARHITFAREELVRSYRGANRVAKAFNRLVIAAFCVISLPLAFHPMVYRRSLGMSPIRGFLAVHLGSKYRENATFMCEPIIRYFHEAELIEGRVTKLIWRATRSVPADIHEQVFGKPLKQHEPSLLGRAVRRLVGA